MAALLDVFVPGLRDMVAQQLCCQRQHRPAWVV